MKRKRIIDVCVYVYTLIFILYSFAGRILPFSLFIGDKINSIVYVFLAGFGCLLVISDILTERVCICSKYFWILCMFIATMALSSIVNIEMGYVDNVKTIIWTTIQIAIFYSLYLRRNKEESLYLIRWLFIIICALWTVMIIFALIQYIAQDMYIYDLAGIGFKYQGFYGGRLFGIFNDPNYAAVTSSYVFFMLLFIYSKSQKKWYVKTLLLIVEILHVLYIFLSGSRTAIIAICCGLFIYLFLKLKTKYINKKFVVLRACIGATVVVMFGFIAGKTMTQATTVFTEIYARECPVAVNRAKRDNILKIMLRGREDVIIYGEESILQSERKNQIEQNENTIAETTELEESTETAESTGTSEITDEPPTVIEEERSNILEREDVQGGNLSNNRLTIWKEYLQGMKGRYLIGTSPRNVMAYLEKTGTAKFVLERQYETHNGYLSAFVGCGIIGCIPIVLFAILMCIRIIKYCFSNKKIDNDFAVLFAIIVIILVYTFFFTELFFVNNLTTVLFWTILGSLWYWLDAENKISK